MQVYAAIALSHWDRAPLLMTTFVKPILWPLIWPLWYGCIQSIWTWSAYRVGASWWLETANRRLNFGNTSANLRNFKRETFEFWFELLYRRKFMLRRAAGEPWLCAWRLISRSGIRVCMRRLYSNKVVAIAVLIRPSSSEERMAWSYYFRSYTNFIIML